MKLIHDEMSFDEFWLYISGVEDIYVWSVIGFIVLAVVQYLFLHTTCVSVFSYLLQR